MAVHVFWDNSNIWIGLQELCRKEENVPPAAVRVSIKNLDDYVVHGRNTGAKMISGSYPPECEEYKRVAESLGYNAKFLQLVDHNGSKREQGVDMSLQNKMGWQLLHGKNNEVMAVLTGDSHVDIDSDTSFIGYIETALEKGWTVEVYAVKHTISEKVYAPLLQKYPDNLIIYYLDDIYKQITFIVEGDFFFPENPSNIIKTVKRESEAKSW